MNKVLLIGNLTADPEQVNTSSGASVCRFSIAVNRRNVGSQEERVADFFRITAFGKTAENCVKFLAKGRKVGVSGRIEINDYTDKEGNKRQSFNIIAEEIEFLSQKRDGENESAPTSGKPKVIEASADELPF